MSEQHRSGFEELAQESKLYPQESLLKIKILTFLQVINSFKIE